MELIELEQSGIQKMIDSVVNKRQNANSRATYNSALKQFFAWYDEGEYENLGVETMREYLLYLEKRGKTRSTVSTHISVLRQLFKDLRRMGVIDENTYSDLMEIRVKPQLGRRIKNWLKQEEVGKLIREMKNEKLKDIRDRAIIAAVIGTGLRRFEICNLKTGQFQEFEERYVFANIQGKGDRYRTVPIPEYTLKCLEEWLNASESMRETDDENIFFSIKKNGMRGNSGITPQGIRDLIVKHTEKILGKPVLPHDLRRTFAQLAYKNGADLRQVQIALGHSSIRTTEVYLGLDQDFTNAPGDYIQVEL